MAAALILFARYPSAALLIAVMAVVAMWLKRKVQIANGEPVPTVALKSIPATKSRARILSPIGRREVSSSISDCWVHTGTTVVVSGYILPMGMLYVGENLVSVSGDTIEPALIDPTLALDHRIGEDDASMPYWPSYSRITPGARAAYLEWLAAGRGGGANIGHVFLFFYGIERRLLFDMSEVSNIRNEAQALIAEVVRLRDLYAYSSSFHGYATRLLSIAPLLMGDSWSGDIAPPRDRDGWDFPINLKVGLGRLVATGARIPPDWALAWLRTHPDVSLRTAAQRCDAEFDALFGIRYCQKYGEGLLIKPNKTPLRLTYYPASSSFRRSLDVDSDGLPDVTRLTSPVNKLTAIADQVCDELASYSRWVGKHNDRTSPAALALLPVDLAHDRNSIDQDNLTRFLDAVVNEHDVATVEVTALASRWNPIGNGSLTSAEAALMAGSIARYGYGVEPDVRYNGIDLSRHKQAVIFRMPGDVDTVPGAAYRMATLMLHLGSVVGAAGSQALRTDMTELELRLQRILRLTAVEQRRLHAHSVWLSTNPPRASHIKARAATLAESDRRIIVRFLIAVAAADGIVTAGEIEALGKSYALLGLPREQVHGDLHELSSTDPASDPVSVLRRESDDSRYRIPAIRERQSDDAIGIKLDPARVASVMVSTNEVYRVLSDVFEAHVEVVAAQEVTDAADMQDSEDLSLQRAGLGDSHVRLVHEIGKRVAWSRIEFDDLATSLGLMPAGAIEEINSAAFAIAGQALIDGHDVIEIDQDTLKEMLSD